MDINILDDPISYITYISKVPSTFPISEKFPMDTHCNIYVVTIYNDEPELASTAVQIIRYKQKRAISSFVMISLYCQHPYALTSLL